MLKRYGSLLWHQTRDIKYLNYPNHIVWELCTNQGFIYVAKNKKTQEVEYTEKPIMIDTNEAIMVKKPQLQ
jgi:hypothetical protein